MKMEMIRRKKNRKKVVAIAKGMTSNKVGGLRIGAEWTVFISQKELGDNGEEWGTRKRGPKGETGVSRNVHQMGFFYSDRPTVLCSTAQSVIDRTRCPGSL